MSPKWSMMPVFAFAALAPAATASAAEGLASWYGNWHDGLRTSSGETFDQDSFTAASRSLPLGARVRVTLHETGQSVVVRVNDRMGGRSALIDLSRGAAREIGLLGRGRGMVSIEPAAGEPVEVAEASDDGAADATNTARRGRRHTHRGGHSAALDRRCCHMPSVVLARHVVQHRTLQHRL